MIFALQTPNPYHFDLQKQMGMNYCSLLLGKILSALMCVPGYFETAYSKPKLAQVPLAGALAPCQLYPCICWKLITAVPFTAWHYSPTCN